MLSGDHITTEPIAKAVAAEREGAGPAAEADGNRPSRVIGWVIPSIADWLFVAMLAWLFLGHNGAETLLADGDAGWHIRLGEIALRDGALPATDPFSFTMAGRVWFAWEWLADVSLAAAHQAGGLAGTALLGGTLIAATFALQLRFMSWLGVNLVIGIAAAVVASTISTIHWLARPHLFTWVFLIVSLWLLEADRRRPRRALWLLVPLAAVWTNMHGGWVALIVTAGIFGVGVAAEQVWSRWQAGDHSLLPPPAAWRYGSLTLLCLAASALNPYGLELHGHVGDYLQSDFILEHVQEFQSPKFRGESMRLLEIMIFASLVAAAAMVRRGELARPLLMVAWAHATLTSARHAPLFALIAAPYLALEATRILGWAARRRWAVAEAFEDLGADYAYGKAPSERGPWLGWLTLAGVVWAGAMLYAAPSEKWRSNFPTARFPIAAVDALQSRLVGSKVLTTDQWGDYLIYRLNPEFRAFFDGRSDFYDPEIRNDYIEFMSATWRWEERAERYRFDGILAPLEWPLASVLKIHPGWELVYDDGFALYFVRVALGEADLEGAQDGPREGLEEPKGTASGAGRTS